MISQGQNKMSTSTAKIVFGLASIVSGVHFTERAITDVNMQSSSASTTASSSVVAASPENTPALMPSTSGSRIALLNTTTEGRPTDFHDPDFLVRLREYLDGQCKGRLYATSRFWKDENDSDGNQGNLSSKQLRYDSFDELVQRKHEILNLWKTIEEVEKEYKKHGNSLKKIADMEKELAAMQMAFNGAEDAEKPTLKRKIADLSKQLEYKSCVVEHFNGPYSEVNGLQKIISKSPIRVPDGASIGSKPVELNLLNRHLNAVTRELRKRIQAMGIEDLPEIARCVAHTREDRKFKKLLEQEELEMFYFKLRDWKLAGLLDVQFLKTPVTSSDGSTKNLSALDLDQTEGRISPGSRGVKTLTLARLFEFLINFGVEIPLSHRRADGDAYIPRQQNSFASLFPEMHNADLTGEVDPLAVDMIRANNARRESARREVDAGTDTRAIVDMEGQNSFETSLIADIVTALSHRLHTELKLTRVLADANTGKIIYQRKQVATKPTNRLSEEEIARLTKERTPEMIQVEHELNNARRLFDTDNKQKKEVIVPEEAKYLDLDQLQEVAGQLNADIPNAESAVPTNLTTREIILQGDFDFWVEKLFRSYEIGVWSEGHRAKEVLFSVIKGFWDLEVDKAEARVKETRNHAIMQNILTYEQVRTLAYLDASPDWVNTLMEKMETVAFPNTIPISWNSGHGVLNELESINWNLNW